MGADNLFSSFTGPQTEAIFPQKKIILRISPIAILDDINDEIQDFWTDNI